MFGGPGIFFWMWLVALFAMAIKFFRKCCCS
ncbi:alanine:cation symporter family protein [Bacillus halotolerans]